ncbi:MAG: lysophospholipid acyltransferase family protein [Mariniphaga sp.]|nr:lysophospholipid acyltransferase family protein [Mariniphaga sp.]MDD4226374.1 lysophospholipid acyltransferase family protein [Mariniphaga sp.]MDD4426638.1 lysophospholipid acyltransferase family protein [Mariniphaga sp.]
MIKPRHHWFVYPFFEWYAWRKIKRNFSKVILSGEVVVTNKPIFIVANHFSWWDGFFIGSLNRKKFHKKFHVMMLEEQLKKNWFLQYTGAFSIQKSSKGVIGSLQYCIDLLQNPGNLVTFFPQGRFESVYIQPLHFEKGMEWLLKNLKNDVQMIFAANQVDYFESVKPYLFMHFQEYNYSGKAIHTIEKDYNLFYQSCALRNITLKDEPC